MSNDYAKQCAEWAAQNAEGDPWRMNEPGPAVAQQCLGECAGHPSTNGPTGDAEYCDGRCQPAIELAEEADGAQETANQFLTWDSESGWAVQAQEQIGKDVERAHYCGYGHPEWIALLGLDPSESPKVVTTVLGNNWLDNDYLYATYELVDDAGVAHGTFTTCIDGRA